MNRNPLPTTVALALGLLIASMTSLARAQGDPPVGSGPARNPAYTLVVTPARRVRAELTIQLDMPQLAVQEWIVYAAQLPVVPSQTGVSSTLQPEGRAGRELSAEHRPILRARIPAKTPERKHGLELRMEYQATLLARRLVRAPSGEDNDTLTPPLGPDARRVALAPAGLFDFNSGEFRRWLDDQRLRRGPDEGEIDFARRVFLAIKGGFKYVYDDAMDRHASHVCRAGQSDFGGLVVLFVSALRANRVPARVLAGRWAVSSTVLEGKVFNQQHAKAEFFAEGVGWVPADLASAAVHDKSPEGLAFFGNDEGDFLVMHLDTDLICDTIHFGRQTVEWLQAPKYWVTGSGTFDKAVTRESWGVTTSPAPEPVEATLKKPAPRMNRPGGERPGSPRQ